METYKKRTFAPPDDNDVLADGGEALDLVKRQYTAGDIDREELDGRLDHILSCELPRLPRSGLLAPRLLRVGLPVSTSELASTMDTAFTRPKVLCSPSERRGVLRTVPDSAGDVPLRVVRSVPLLPDRHSDHAFGARFLSTFERRTRLS